MAHLWNHSEIKAALGSQILHLSGKQINIDKVVIDSRTKVENGLFVAFRGENNDGHNFLNQAFENGCIAAIVEKIPEEFQGDERLILVKNSIASLEHLAAFSRARSNAKIIAVTGSVGKTSVKEMLKFVFATQGKTYATIGNLNNHFGLPLTLCNMPEDTDFAVLEMGMNHKGEIEKLSKLARPHIAIITTVAAAHIGNFANEEEIALAKAEIFDGLEVGGFAIINVDNHHFELIKSQALLRKIPEDKIITFGKKEISNIRLLAIENGEDFNSKITVLTTHDKQQISYEINNINHTTIVNSLIVIACLNLIGKDISSGLEAFKQLETPKGRGNLIRAKKDDVNFIVIDDSYNANAESMRAGLKFLCDLKAHKKGSRAIAFIGDMLELGEFSDDEHLAISNYVETHNIDKVLLVGDLMRNLITKIPPEKLLGHFDNSTLAAEKINFQPREGDIILVKGSRGTRMEKLIEKLLS